MPWLARVAHAAHEAGAQSASRRCIVACSALKQSYRDTLRDAEAMRVVHVYLRLAPALLLERLEQRKGHFMKAAMLESQLETLEEPYVDKERDILVVDIVADSSPAMVLHMATQGLEALL